MFLQVSLGFAEGSPSGRGDRLHQDRFTDARFQAFPCGRQLYHGPIQKSQPIVNAEVNDGNQVIGRPINYLQQELGKNTRLDYQKSSDHRLMKF